MASAYILPTAATPIERILSRFTREQVEDFIEVAISLLDVANDPDLELNGDEADGSLTAEDEFGDHLHGRDFMPGCPITDPAEMDDEPENEWDQEQVDEDGVEEMWLTKPICGIDQTQPPTNPQ